MTTVEMSKPIRNIRMEEAEFDVSIDSTYASFAT
jgi:hypothetical protein